MLLMLQYVLDSSLRGNDGAGDFFYEFIIFYNMPQCGVLFKWPPFFEEKMMWTLILYV